MAPFVRDVLSEETIRRQGLLDPAAVTQVLDAHESRREDLSRQLWGLMTLTLWIEQHGGAVAGAGTAPALRDGVRA